ncbi:GntR family transcriptional regulator [Gordonia sp. HY285]|uniref:GntR family transcriptional regulator n=1 Tax=Gordonia liuliyuniae TaxID=2911517 RepID=UPI001F355D75|nr:GntR family transcriptional regulator [Gordonia liuliyuniae]MCF8609194.1 GntR family transcriptional regulator [Gordonia liuliyuniae]
MAAIEQGGPGGRRQQLSEHVAAYVRESILTGQARPGTFLRTEALVEAVGVSNTPVREGLLIVAGEGFVELVPRRGYRVAEVSRRDIRDMFLMQASIASELARRAAASITDERLAELTDLVAEHRRADQAGDDEATVRLGHQFHRAVNLAAESPRMTLVLGGLVKQLPNRFYNDIEGHNHDTEVAHPKILDALRARDGEVAASVMHAHIMDGADELVPFLESQGMWG